MKPEIEAKFLSVNKEAIRTKLGTLGAECKQPMQLMRRVVFDLPGVDDTSAYLRIRDEGHRITMTYKQFDDISLTGAKEIEIIVNDYDTAIALVGAVGIPIKSDQEARRETWKLGEAEIVIDEWPWIEPFIEIEGPTEEVVRGAAKTLGLQWKDAAFGDIMTAYRSHYPHTSPDDAVYHLPAIRFEDPLPTMLKA